MTCGREQDEDEEDLKSGNERGRGPRVDETKHMPTDGQWIGIRLLEAPLSLYLRPLSSAGD